MLRATITRSFAEEELQTVKNKMLNWVRPFSIFAYLDNNKYENKPNRFELLLAAGCLNRFKTPPGQMADWLFGHWGYDYKNVLEPGLGSRHEEHIGFADSFFFQPEIVAYIPWGATTLYIEAASEQRAKEIWTQIRNTEPEIVSITEHEFSAINWHSSMSREEYVGSVERLRMHIEEGDCYEINFCKEASACAAGVDPVHTFHRLNTLNPSPFAALYRNDASWLMCASPERFLYRQDNQLVAQPIKGTSKRSSDLAEDNALKQALYGNEKERAENVMIVDLLRNDLAKSCKPGTIVVPELFGVYTFPQVHQLISTVTGTVNNEISNETIIGNAFPMGSMTGAPKVMVMQLIEQYERSRRGIYSGAVGYITPGGNFDFNVVIRSLMYNGNSGYLSYQTGGAITYDSDPEAEWEETRLKAFAMEQVFRQ